LTNKSTYLSSAGKAAANAIVTPVILSGGSGSRLWPLSRSHHPKQLLPLVTERTMIQETASRLPVEQGFGKPLVVCNEAHRFMIAEQMRSADISPCAIVLEPCSRNTAFAAAASALILVKHDPDALMLLMPADHAMTRATALAEIVRKAAPAAAEGHMVTFGIQPDAPETGYGYIRIGRQVEDQPGSLFEVGAFVEKPSKELATGYLADGRYLWNSGMFLFSAKAFLDELERFAPDVLTAAEKSVDAGRDDLDFFRLDQTAMEASPNISIDYAVMEHTDRARVVPVDLGWTDVGGFEALWSVSERSEDGNAVQGDVITIDTRDSYIRTDGKLVATVGVKDLVLVVTEDAVLAANRGSSQDIRKVVDVLKETGRSEAMQHQTIHRPWGWFQRLHVGDRYQVKRLMINPNARIQLQKHAQRAEHWVVVAGEAKVTLDGTERIIGQDESILIPVGSTHSVENTTDEPLIIVEVQSGAYLGEDDVTRFEQRYGTVTVD
tara:strand:- start:480 stop:1961 length:1482 start_codon:yes stop_codon:yes gene_type:complete